MIRKKFKAGALQFAILISVVVAVLLSSFLLLTHTQQRLHQRVGFAQETIRISHTGIAYAKQQQLAYNTVITPDIETVPVESLTLQQSHWGIYDKLIAQAQWKKHTHQKIALLGGQFPSNERPALYLEDTNTPLVLVGNTSITGNAYLPRQGVKAGNIAGNYYQGNTLINGDINPSNRTLPQLSKAKKDYLEALIFGRPPLADSLYIQSTSAILEHQFDQDALWLYRSGVIDLTGTYRTNIIVKSDTLIRVSAFAKAENIILVAPIIQISSGFSGTIQAFASKGIEVSENVSLNYPSAVLLWEKETDDNATTDNIQIALRKGSRISGSVAYIGTATQRITRPKILLETESLVYGEVYSEQPIQLSGSVEGSVFTHGFATQERGSIYQNHIYNGAIDVRNLPESYCGLFTGNTQTNLVTWLY